MTARIAFILHISWVSRLQERFVCRIEEPQPPDLLSPMKTCKEADILNIGQAAMHKEMQQQRDTKKETDGGAGRKEEGIEWDLQRGKVKVILWIMYLQRTYDGTVLTIKAFVLGDKSWGIEGVEIIDIKGKLFKFPAKFGDLTENGLIE